MPSSVNDIKAAYTKVDQLASVYKESCRYATFLNLSAANLVHDWIGETATGSVESSTFDNYGITGGELALADRILVMSQTDTKANGIYIVEASGLSRSSDFDGSSDIKGGILVNVMNGNTNSNKIYMLTDIVGEHTVGKTAITFVPFATGDITTNTTNIATNVANIATNVTNIALKAPISTTVTKTGSQTLTNKSLTSPTITGTGAIAGTFTGAVTGNADTSTKISSITNSNIVQLAASQTLTNKSLTSPTITGTGAIAGTFTGAVTGNADTSTKIASITNSNIVQLAESQTLTNKSLTSPTITGTGAIAGAFTGAVTGNADTSTKITSITNSNIVQLAESQTLTNKSLTSPTITNMGTMYSTSGMRIGRASGNAEIKFDVTDTITLIGSSSIGVAITGNLNVDGYISATGNITAYSDKRLKENFKLISSPNDKLKMINGYEFDWIKMNNGKHDIGVIAQEIEEVLPELVLQDSEGYKSVDYSKIVSLLIESNKDLLRRIEVLEAR